MRIVFTVEDLFVIEPLGLMQLISLAKKLGHQCYFAPYRSKEFLPLIKNIKPDMVAISIMSISDKSGKTIIENIKKISPKIFILAGGPHPTYYPEFISQSRADAICVGEGDGAFADVLQALQNGKSIRKIPNIWTKNSKNPPRPLVENLDQLPFPDRDLVYQNSHLGQMKLKSFMATRGCPYSCTYCFNSAFKKLYLHKGPALRRRSVENLIQEIEWVKANYPLEMIRFGDDNFVEGVTGWLEEFVSQYSKRIKLPFYCLLRPNVVTPRLAKLMKQAGCISVATSIETGNEEIRQKILKRAVSDAQIIKACRTLIDHGIKTYTNIMIGLPETSIKDEIKSIDLASRCKTTYAAFTIFTPFPGTELYQYCIDKGYLPKATTPHFPRSTTDRSILNCFTDKEKDIQKNILLLGSIANINKALRFFVLKILIYLPPNQIFFYLSFLVRNYYNYFYIWPFKLTVGEFFRLVRTVRQHDRKYFS